MIFFLLPIFILFIGIEMYFRHYKNAFAIKAGYLAKHKSDIEVLILGSSHHQNGLNPAFFSHKTCNLAYASQDIKIDSAMFFSNARDMKNLKAVVFELDYHRPDIENGADYFRYPWYDMYYGFEVAPVKFINKLSLYSSNPVFFNNNLMSIFKGEYKPQEINAFGYVEKNNLSKFRDMKHDSVAIFASAGERLKGKDKDMSDAIFARNRSRIISMIDYCRQHHLRIYFFSSPLYLTYRNNMVEAKKLRFDRLTAELKNDYHVPYYDFHDDKRFTLKDFADDDHLNPEGAKIYSKIIDSIIHLN